MSYFEISGKAFLIFGFFFSLIMIQLLFIISDLHEDGFSEKQIKEKIAGNKCFRFLFYTTSLGALFSLIIAVATY